VFDAPSPGAFIGLSPGDGSPALDHWKAAADSSAVKELSNAMLKDESTPDIDQSPPLSNLDVILR